MLRRLRRLLAPGLRRQLAGWIVVVTVACLFVVFFGVYRGTGSVLRGQIDREIAGDARELAHNLKDSTARSPQQAAAAARRYIATQPFSASSTLLIVLIPGAAPITNQPEVFAHSAPDEGESVKEQDQENRLSGSLIHAPIGYSTVPLEDVGDLRLVKVTVRLPGAAATTIGAGEPLAPVARAQMGLQHSFLLAGLIALGGALLASFLIASRVARPLRRMAAVAARVDGGDMGPRMPLERGEGEEIQVLADSFNTMLDRLADAFAGQRAFVADASHELRTPLTVIRGQLEVLAAQQDPPAEEVRRVDRLVQEEIARVSRLVDDLLLLAKSEQIAFLRPRDIDLGTFVGELWDGMSLIAERRFELGSVPEGILRADPDRLAQALRNLVSNAIEHTEPVTGLVRMAVVEQPAGEICFVVEDDGPGIPPGQREQVFARFHRTDRARDRASGGAGLGLAISRAIVLAHGGSVSAGESVWGGARMTLMLPGFAHRAAERPRRPGALRI